MWKRRSQMLPVPAGWIFSTILNSHSEREQTWSDFARRKSITLLLTLSATTLINCGLGREKHFSEINLGNAPPQEANSFPSRCRTPGVLKCVGFESRSDVIPEGTLFPAWDGIYRGTLDTNIKASGASSLRFEIPPYSAANTSGRYSTDFGKDFGENSTFYIQWRQRFSPEMLTTDFRDNGWKQAIFWHGIGGSCTDVQLVTENTYQRGFPILYTDCGSRGLEVTLPDGEILLEQGDYPCKRRDLIAGRPTKCAFYKPNQWMTFYYEVQIGKWNQPTSFIRAWVAYEGEPLRQFIKIDNFTVHNDNPASKAFRRVDLLPYQTNKPANVNHPTAYTWYDEVIISAQPIPAPNGPTPAP